MLITIAQGAQGSTWATAGAYPDHPYWDSANQDSTNHPAHVKWFSAH